MTPRLRAALEAWAENVRTYGSTGYVGDTLLAAFEAEPDEPEFRVGDRMRWQHGVLELVSPAWYAKAEDGTHSHYAESWLKPIHNTEDKPATLEPCPDSPIKEERDD